MTAASETHILVSATTILRREAVGEPLRASSERELERYHFDCHAWAISCCRGDLAEAEDVLQSSYLKVLDGRAVFGSRSSYKTWLFGVIRRTAAEHRRRRVLRRLWGARPLDGLQLADPAPDPATVTGRSDSTRRLTNALATLPRRQREVLHLVFYQDLSIRDAADVLGISIGSARTHYERGKNRLRERLTLDTEQ
jgi:RNA polymerase sigma factor (sigma-70 family)